MTVPKKLDILFSWPNLTSCIDNYIFRSYTHFLDEFLRFHEWSAHWRPCHRSTTGPVLNRSWYSDICPLSGRVCSRLRVGLPLMEINFVVDIPFTRSLTVFFTRFPEFPLMAVREARFGCCQNETIWSKDFSMAAIWCHFVFKFSREGLISQRFASQG